MRSLPGIPIEKGFELVRGLDASEQLYCWLFLYTISAPLANCSKTYNIKYIVQ